MKPSTLTTAVPLVAVAFPLPIRLAAGHAAAPLLISSSAVVLHCVAPAGSIFVPLCMEILKLFRPLGTPFATSGSPNSTLKATPVDDALARLDCLKLKVVAWLEANATVAVAAAATARTPKRT